MFGLEFGCSASFGRPCNCRSRTARWWSSAEASAEAMAGEWLGQRLIRSTRVAVRELYTVDTKSWRKTIWRIHVGSVGAEWDESSQVTAVGCAACSLSKVPCRIHYSLSLSSQHVCSGVNPAMITGCQCWWYLVRLWLTYPCLVYCKRKVFLSIRLPVVPYQQCIETLAIGYPDETVLLHWIWLHQQCNTFGPSVAEGGAYSMST